MSDRAHAMSAQTKALAAVLKPLTGREERSAIKVATTSLRAKLSDRFRVIGTELRIDKPAPGTNPARLVGVYIVDYGNDRSVEALVGARGELVAVNDLPPHQVPISGDEIREAQSIAARDEAVAPAMKRHKTTFVSPFTPHDHASKKRVVGLRYFSTDRRRRLPPRPIGEAEVDLGTRSVRFTAIAAEGE
jgi:hypothetical protein